METQPRVKHEEDGNNADTEIKSAAKEAAQIAWCVAQHAVFPFQACETGTDSASDFRQVRLLAGNDWHHRTATPSPPVAPSLSVFPNILSNRTPQKVYALK